MPQTKFDLAANTAAACGQIAKMAAFGAQIVVLPEACLQGYITEEPSLTKQKLLAHAEPVNGPHIAAIPAAAF